MILLWSLAWLKSLTLTPLEDKLPWTFCRPATHILFKVTVVKGRGQSCCGGAGWRSGLGIGGDNCAVVVILHQDDIVHSHKPVVTIALDGLDGDRTDDEDLGVLPQCVALRQRIIKLPENLQFSFDSETVYTFRGLK